jgi:hypothetical protein
MAGGTFDLKEMYQMSNGNPQSRKLRELLNQIKSDQMPLDEYDIDPENLGTFNSHTLFQEASAKIIAEQDINLVREIALDYLNAMCSAIPDFVSTKIYLKMHGIQNNL